MQAYRTGEIGAPPALATYAQLLRSRGRRDRGPRLPSAPRHVRHRGRNGLQAPTAAEVGGSPHSFTRDSRLPHGAITALVIAVVLGIVFHGDRGHAWKKYCPSPTGIGIGMLVPAARSYHVPGRIGSCWRCPNTGRAAQRRAGQRKTDAHRARIGVDRRGGARPGHRGPSSSRSGSCTGASGLRRVCGRGRSGNACRTADPRHPEA